MLVSLEWLREYVDVDITPEELADRLTMAGLAVEGLEYTGGEIKGVVVGKIEDLEEHPEADKLKIARVRVSDERLVTLVSGAPNLVVGSKVPVALPGATLPGEVSITETEFRGVLSEGMVCSEQELGLADHSAGVLILPSDAPVGADVVKYLGLRDVILDIELTANRPDCYSMLGVAREVAAVLNKEVRYPDTSYGETNTQTSDLLEVTVVDEDLCPRYMAKVLTEVKVGESPFWLKKRLIRAGMRPINNVVDITNFVLLEQNQPLHAFDYDKLFDGRIVVRRARDNEALTTLDDEERSLSEEMLVIADSERPVCIAGVMGGANSEVDEGTVTVALESAWFSSVSLRRTGRILGLRSEASARFERGINPENVPVALNRAVQLMIDLCGAKACRGVIDIYPNPEKPTQLQLTEADVNNLLGTGVSASEIENVLQRLPGFVLQTQSQGQWLVQVPSYRRDINFRADLIEEVARLIGYDTIPETLPSSPEVVGLLTPEQQRVEKIRDLLVGAGLTEIYTYSLDTEGRYERLGLSDKLTGKVDLVVPLSEDHRLMRTSMLPSIIETLSYNYNRGHKNLSLFELGRTYVFRGQERLPVQDLHLSLALMGYAEGENWYGETREFDFFDLKGLIELIMEEMDVDLLRFESGDNMPYHPGRNATIIWKDRIIGGFGELHPAIAKDFGFAGKVLIGEINIESVVAKPVRETKFKPLPKFPASRKDISVVVSDTIPAADVEREIADLAGKYLEEVHLFDQFSGEKIGEGNKSLAFSLVLRHPDRTLNDQEIAGTMQRVAEGLKSRLGAELRG